MLRALTVLFVAAVLITSSGCGNEAESEAKQQGYDTTPRDSKTEKRPAPGKQAGGFEQQEGEGAAPPPKAPTKK